ncbi:outer membrane lipoprotein-sorting protein [Candidatus Poribacteria bacterium]|nr:outer membrane lipoprotein-sorting protein [Candidatus Poribacteria bacterium]
MAKPTLFNTDFCSHFKTNKAHKTILGLITCCFLMFVITVNVFTADHVTASNVEEIIKNIDQLYRSKTSHADMEMHIVTPHYERTLKMLIWTKGTDKTFIRITAPKKEQGVATLRIGNEMWNYLPKVNKTMKISPSMMMGSWMGSDFTNDDLVKESSMLDDYTYQLITPEDASADLLYVQLIPKEDTSIVWGKIIAAVRATDYIPVWQHFYDEKGKLMRVLNFKEIKTFGRKTIPSVMEMIPQNKGGHKTVVRWLSATFDSNVDDKIFTRRNLQKRR